MISVAATATPCLAATSSRGLAPSSLQAMRPEPPAQLPGSTTRTSGASQVGRQPLPDREKINCKVSWCLHFMPLWRRGPVPAAVCTHTSTHPINAAIIKPISTEGMFAFCSIARGESPLQIRMTDEIQQSFAAGPSSYLRARPLTSRQRRRVD